MKKICLAVMIFAFVPATASAGLYYEDGFGVGLDGGVNFTVDIGYLWHEDVAQKRGILAGVGVAAIVLGSNEIPSTVQNEEPPAGEITEHKFERNLEWGFFGKFGAELLPGKNLYLLGVAGRTETWEKYAAFSHVDGLYYDLGNKYHHYTLFGIGVGYYKTIMIELDVDSRRGVTLLFGGHF